MALALRAVSKAYTRDRFAVSDVSLEIETGGSMALVGGSGSGKTTLLKLINRLLEPTSGQILIEGQDVSGTDVYAHRRRFGYVVQRGGLFPHLKVGHNVFLPGKLQGWPLPRLEERARELLELVELPYAEYADRYPAQLSGGQQQRVGIARALFLDPAYLLLDEPLGALDPVTRRQLQQQIHRLAQNKTLVVVTHDMEEAEVLCRRVAVMRLGRLVQQGTPHELREHPADDFVRQMFL